MKPAPPCAPYNVIVNPFNGPPSVAGARKHAAVDFSGYWASMGTWGTWVWVPIPNGADVVAPIDGIVTEVGSVGQPGYGATGNMIEITGTIIVRGRSIVASYRMLHMQAVLVARGTVVRRGQLVARANNTGTSTGTHVHLAIWIVSYGDALWIQPDPEPVYGKYAVDPEIVGFDFEEDDMFTDDDRKNLATVTDLVNKIFPVESQLYEGTLAQLYNRLYRKPEFMGGVFAVSPGVSTVWWIGWDHSMVERVGATVALALGSGSDSAKALAMLKQQDPGVIWVRRSVSDPLTYSVMRGNWTDILVLDPAVMNKIPIGKPIPSLA